MSVPLKRMQVLQEFQQQLFVQKNMAFQQAPDFMFQPVDSDTVNTDVFLFLFIIKCIKYHMRLLLVIIGENKLVFIMHGMKSPTLKI